MIPKEYYGRLFTKAQLPVDYLSEAVKLESMIKVDKKLRCKRCYSQIEEDWQLPNGQYYCRACIVFGRNQEGKELYYFPSEKPEVDFPVLKWLGKLTPYQNEVSEKLLKTYKNQKHSLVHAVTGAGKTEMIYKIVAYVLENKNRVAIASPRVDVCRELFLRMQKDFTCSISLLHADSEPYDGSPLVIATTHQLLKFYHSFDLIIVDEVDAFPFVGNVMLNHAVKQAKTETGRYIYLTATSTLALEEQVRLGALEKHHLARRFHGNPLVFPRFFWQGRLQKSLTKGKLPSPLIHQIKKQRKSNFPLLIFFPNIAIGEKFSITLKKYLPTENIAFVSSKSEERSTIVEKFRKKELSILVTTTILERGVTFPKVDVFVCMANHHLYTSSSLIQIGGRVGRSPERPTGKLYFFHEGLSKSMLQCRKEINAMNKKGGFENEVSTM